MLEILEQEFQDEVYLAVLADFLEETGHPWAAALRLLSTKVCFLDFDDRIGIPEKCSFDLWVPRTMEVEGCENILGWNPNTETDYGKKTAKFKGMNRFSFGSVTEAIEALAKHEEIRRC